MKVTKAWCFPLQDSQPHLRRMISKLAVTEPLYLCESRVKMALFSLEGLVHFVLSPSSVFEVILKDDYKVTSWIRWEKWLICFLSLLSLVLSVPSSLSPGSLKYRLRIQVSVMPAKSRSIESRVRVVTVKTGESTTFHYYLFKTCV